ncbi:hypothetical protein JCM8097_006846 [Rhodosporidiobolus ruineniae]
MLSSLAGSVSSVFHRPQGRQEGSGAPADDVEEGAEHSQAGPAPTSDHPHTPEQRNNSQRLSPHSLSASGSQTMATILSAHPHFSVFRKGNSSHSLEDIVAGRLDDSPGSRGDGDDLRVEDLRGEEEMETLATPPNGSPSATSKANTSANSDNSSFHLSLDSGDMPSLNFGDHSSVSISPANSPSSAPPSRAGSVSPSTAPQNASPLSQSFLPSNSVAGHSAGGGSVRLVPDSPPTTRTPSRQSLSRSSSLDASESRRKMRSSAGPVQRVQFSPLSLCPSPLINAPTLPPPPPPPPFGSSPPRTVERAWREETPEEMVARGILKAPRTPGTGRSVRFSASTARRSAEELSLRGEISTVESEEGRSEREDEDEEEGPNDSPSVLPGSRSLHRSQPIEVVETSLASVEVVESSAEDMSLVEPSVEEEHSSLLVSTSLLSRLQAIAPSPDVSLVFPPALSADLPSIAVKPSTPSTTFAHPHPPAPSSDTSHSLLLAGSTSRDGSASMLFDESNPFAHLNSLQAGTHTGAGGPSAILGPSTSTSVLLVDASLGGVAGAGGPSFGGDSFAQVSYLQQHQRSYEPHRLEEIDEEDEEEGASAATLAAGGLSRVEDVSTTTTITSHTPRRAPSSPSSHPRTPSDAAGPGRASSSLRTSDMSSVAEHSPPHSPVLSGGSVSPIPPAYSSLPPSPPPSAELSPAPPAITPSASTAAEASTASAANASVGGTSFYRHFMALRASSGLSESARREYERLERGEKASPKELARARSAANEDAVPAAVPAAVPTPASTPAKGGKRKVEEVEGWEEAEEGVAAEGEAEMTMEGESVYYSPRKEEYEEDGIRFVGAGGEEVLNEEDAEPSMIDHGMGRATFLSPIVEVSEPESNANTPFEPSSSRRVRPGLPPPPQPSFAAALSASLAQPAPISTLAPPATPSRPLPTRAPATPLSASKIPRPRNPITPSQNPFLLQLSRAAPLPSGAPNKAAQLLGDLFSAQADQLATSSNQRFLLSSLVTNLQNEVECKEEMVGNLRRQVDAAREEVREVEQLALEWERRFREVAALAPSSSIASSAPLAAEQTAARHDRERKKVAALEETVQLLADELETRIGEDRQHRLALEADLERSRAELSRRAHDVREAEIRLRFAEEARERAEGERDDRRREAEKLREENEAVKAGWAADVAQRDEALQRLREEVAAPGQHAETASAAALEDARRDVSLVKQELVQRDATVASLRETTSSQRDEIDRLNRAVQNERQQAELAHADLAATLEAKEDELVAVQDAHAALQDELDDALQRLEGAEAERDRFADLLARKEEQLAQTAEENATVLSAVRELETQVQRVEVELERRAEETRQARKELEQQRREGEDVLEKRDRVLAESEKAAARARKELEGVQKENNRLNDLVGKLRRDSADREVKITKLKKRAAELEEDVFGLNIALDAKQQEASHWKRQMSALKHERERAAAVAAALADSTSSAVPPTISRPALASVTGTATNTHRRSHSSFSFSSAKPKLPSATPVPSEKTKSRPSIARRPADVIASSATETEEDEGVEASHDLTLASHDNEKTPSRAAVRRSSSSAPNVGVGLGLPKSRSSTSTALSGSRRRSSSAEQAAVKENEPPVGVSQGRRREAVLA